MKRLLILSGLIMTWSSAIGEAQPASVSSTLSVTVFPQYGLSFSPANPTIPCNIPGGTVVAAVVVSGGDGNPTTLSISGDTTDFTLSGSNIVVVPGGITSASGKCPLVASVVETVTVNATQP